MTTASGTPADIERSAMTAYRRGELVAASEGYAAARTAYDAAGNAPKAAEMANNLCVVLVALGRAQEAVAAVQGTAETFTQAGDPLNAARAVGNLAAALEAAGELDRAVAAYERAIEGLHAAGDRTGESQTWQALSRLQLRRGDPLTAAASAQAALNANPKPGLVRRFLRGMVNLAYRLPRP